MTITTSCICLDLMGLNYCAGAAPTCPNYQKPTQEAQHAGKKLLLIDGMALVHRGYHAVKEPRLTPEGIQTNAVFGFTQLLLAALDRERPDFAIVAFEGGKTYRHSIFPEYKGSRKQTPQDLVDQIPLIYKLLEMLRIPCDIRTGLEADDVIGVLSVVASRLKMKTVILTGDCDLLQLVSTQVTAIMPTFGLGNYKLFNEGAVLNKYGFYPEYLPDFKAIAGDPSDNIPGVPGLGEVGAKKLIKKWGTVEHMCKHLARRLDISSFTPEEKKFAANFEKAILFKKVTTIAREHRDLDYIHFLWASYPPLLTERNVQGYLDGLMLGQFFPRIAKLWQSAANVT